MNPSQRTSGLVFLAAITLIALSSFHNRAITLIVGALLVIFIFGVMVRRGRELVSTPASTSSRKFMMLCVIAPVGLLALTEFKDIQGRRMPIFSQALTAVQSSAQAAQLLGSPIRVSWPVKPIGYLSNDAPEAHLSIPVRGSNGSAHIIADGVSAKGNWKMTNLQLVHDGTVVNLEPLPGTR